MKAIWIFLSLVLACCFSRLAVLWELIWLSTSALRFCCPDWPAGEDLAGGEGVISARMNACVLRGKMRYWGRRKYDLFSGNMD